MPGAKWADQFHSDVREILGALSHEAQSVQVASQAKDTMQATDYVIQTISGDIACRLRRLAQCPHLDFTIRASRPSGTETELAKILSGFARFYLYGWVEIKPELRKWMFVDLDILRRSGLLRDGGEALTNKDGTQFLAISWDDIEVVGALAGMSRCMWALQGYTWGQLGGVGSTPIVLRSPAASWTWDLAHGGR